MFDMKFFPSSRYSSKVKLFKWLSIAVSLLKEKLSLLKLDKVWIPSKDEI